MTPSVMSRGQAKVGPLKLGKFVKAVVLISPVTRLKGLSMLQVMKLLPDDPICHNLSVMIVVGNKSKELLRTRNGFITFS